MLCGVSLSQEMTRAGVSLPLLHVSLFKDRPAPPLPQHSGPAPPLSQVPGSHFGSPPALLVIPAAASFAHALPTAPGVGF